MSERSLPPLSDIYRENGVHPDEGQQNYATTSPQQGGILPEPAPKKSGGYSTRILAGAVVVGCLLLVAFIVAFSMFSKSADNDENVIPEDAPAPQVTAATPSIPEETIPKPKPAVPVKISYKVTGQIADPQAPPQVTITFYNSKGRVQSITRAPEAGSGSFTWENNIINKTNSENKGGLRVTTNIPTKLTCTVTQDGKVIYTRTAENAVNCGMKD